MSFNSPAEVTKLAVASGTTKANLAVPKMLVGGFLAGAYIAFGGLLAIVGSAGLDPKTWGGLITLVTGLVFSLGLILVVVAGAELLTGNMALVPMAVMAGEVSLVKMLLNWFWVTIGNLAGSLFVAYVIADQTGIIKKDGMGTAGPSWTRLAALADAKGITETHLEQFLRAIGCNWLVCLAVWAALAATTVGGKILAIIFPITAFVALGFDHVVANMFFLPLGLFQDTGLTIGETVLNLIFAFLGNAVGAAVFVGGAYYYLYGKTDTPAAKPAPGPGPG